MDKKILQAASEKLKKHKAHMIWVLCLCLLAGLVGTGTYRSLTVSAEALAKDPVCGLEEHTHDMSCYTLGERPLVCGMQESEGHFHNESCFDEEGNLICGQEEHEGHIHSDECYGEAEPVLICGKLEHVHTEACYPAAEEIQPEETVPEETVTEEQDPSAQPETTPKPEETVKPEQTATPEEKTDGEKAEEKSEALEEIVEKEKEKKPLEFEEKSGNVTVKVSFEDDKAFDEEDMPVTMKVEPIKEGSPEYEAYYNQIIDETKINTAEKMFLFDITFVNKDGDEIEPLKTASVSFTSEDIPMPEKEAMDKEEEQLNVVHIPEKGEAEILDAEIKTAEERHDEEKPDIAFETDSFSIYGVVYTVDYFVDMDGKTYSWSMEGGTSVSVTDVLINLGAFTEDKAEAFVKDVKDVDFSRPEVLTIENENDVWMIKSLAPFDTEETLTFTLKNGEVFTLVVTDEQISSELENFLKSITVTGAVLQDDALLVEAGKLYKIELKFKESSQYQFDNDNTLTYKLPKGIKIENTLETSIDIVIRNNGIEYTVPAAVTVDTEGNVSIDIDENSENFPLLESSNNVSIMLEFWGKFTETIKDEKWTKIIDKEIVVDNTDRSDVTAEKTGEFDPETGRFNYKIVVRATGNVTNVNVKDVITGTALNFNDDVTVSGNFSSYTVNPLPEGQKGFDYTFASMNDGEEITITYSANLDTSEVTGGVVTADMTKNTATVKKENGEPHNATHQDNIDLKAISKESKGQTGTASDGDPIYHWVIEYNPLALIPAKGDQITDTIAESAREYMNYDGNVTIKVYNHDGSLKETRYLTPESGAFSWTYTVPSTDETPYRYVFEYDTKVNHTKVNQLSDNITLSNKVTGPDGRTGSGTIIVGPKHKADLDKAVESSNSTEVTWVSHLKVPEQGLSKAVVIDTLPNIAGQHIGYAGTDRTNELFIDLYKNGSLTVDGLLAGESYEVDSTSDPGKVTITFNKNVDGQIVPGLSGVEHGHIITIRLTTIFNEDWKKYNYDNPGGWVASHVNTIEMDNLTKTAEIVVAKPDFKKTGSLTYNGMYFYSLVLSGVDSEPLIIEDHFDKNILEVPTSGVNYTHFLIYAGNQWYQDEKHGYKANYSDTLDGIRITANRLPKQENGEFYPYYKITYYLKLKDGVNLDDLIAYHGGSYSIDNTADWGDHHSEFSYEHKYEPLTKELINPATSTGHIVDYKITFNQKKMKLNDNDEMILTDTLNEHLSLIYSSVKIETDPSDVEVPYAYTGGPDGSTIGTFHIPDQTSITITYSARVIGVGSFKYVNTARVEGYTERIVSQDVEFHGQGGGQGDVANLEIVKVDGYNANKKLAGVQFTLHGCRLDPNDTSAYDPDDPEKQCVKDSSGKTELISLSKPGTTPVYEKTFTTNENGIFTIDGSTSIWINSDEAQYRYFLNEIEPLSHYQRLAETYVFSVADDMKYVDYKKYIYYLTDTFQIKNWPLQGLVVGKKVESPLEEDKIRKYHFRVTLLKTDDQGKEIIDDITKTYGAMHFENGVATFDLGDGEQISAYSMPEDIRYRVEEIDDEGKVITEESGFVVTYTVTEPKQTPIEGVGAIYEGVTDSEYTLVTFTNQKNKTSVYASKNWLDKNGQAAIPIPENAEVTFTLLANGVLTEHAVVLNGVDETAGGATPQSSDYEGADWTAYFTNLPRYDEQNVEIVYTIRETGTWGGYKIVGNDTVSSGGVITNKEISVSLDILKVAKGDENIKLAGATFKLDQINGEASEDSVISGTTKTVTTDKNGAASFTDLSEGYYRIEETDTPDGYLIVGESTFYIKVTAEGVRLLTKGTGKPSTWADDATNYGNVIRFTVASESSNATAVVENTPGAELPHTGGSGTMIYTIIGTALIAIAGILLVRRKRNEAMN